MRAAATDAIEGLAAYRRPRPEPGWREDLIRNSQGAPKALLANAITALRAAPEWQGVLAYNSFALTTTLMAPPPWHAGANDWQPRVWVPRDDVLATNWLQHNGIAVGVDVTQEAVEAVAQDAPFHPVQDYLEGLQWDQQARIGTWLPDYLGVERTSYTDAVGQAFLISAVARALNPGCKVDTMPILEGGQGVGKSTTAKILAGPWFTDEIADFGSREAAMQVAGVWIAEISELDAMTRGEIAKTKAFLSRSTDRYRPPYGTRVIEVPRPCVFIGTTNSDAYLKDETGGRRFWPVSVRNLDLGGLERNRDQLWAEAVARYREGAAWWLDDAELVRAAGEEQAARYLSDPWHDVVAKFVVCQSIVDIAEILRDGVCIHQERWTQVDQNRVARILKSLGFTRKQIRDGHERKYRYVREAGTNDGPSYSSVREAGRDDGQSVTRTVLACHHFGRRSFSHRPPASRPVTSFGVVTGERLVTKMRNDSKTSPLSPLSPLKVGDFAGARAGGLSRPAVTLVTLVTTCPSGRERRVD